MKSDFQRALGPALSQALERRGYTRLTPVQNAVLDRGLAGRDLRITSQTGSGKTLAIGFALRELLLVDDASSKQGLRAVVITPTRELAKQVEVELSWLYAETPTRVLSVTGGASYRDERRALGKRPSLLIGTPGRLLDHLQQGTIDVSSVKAVVLDEADRMLDMGFREELDAILDRMPEGRRTHLVSATFPRAVRALADRVQESAAHVEGTRLGEANADIDHVIHLIDGRERMSAIINLLLARPAEQTLVFARTRAEVAEIGRELADAGFPVASLSGEMAQRERNLALYEFKQRTLQVMVATDVAARGIDVQNIARVIHAEAPTDPDSYTHRSGRTGRAGRKGVSAVLITATQLPRVKALFHHIGVPFRIDPIPTEEVIRRMQDDFLYQELTDTSSKDVETAPAWAASLAKRLAESSDVETTLVRLLTRMNHPARIEPRAIRRIDPAQLTRPARSTKPAHSKGNLRNQKHARKVQSWATFHVSGKDHGIDPGRLLAILCRRGGIRSSDVGAIRIDRGSSTVEVASQVADAFAAAAAKPDKRDGHIKIQRAQPSSGRVPATPRRPSQKGAHSQTTYKEKRKRRA